VLTTPIIRCLKNQTQAEIHFLVKPQFEELLIHNPHISKIIPYESSISEKLQLENYTVIIDLQKSRKTVLLRKKLGIQSVSFNKLNVKKWLLVQSGINLLPEKHIVDRYFNAVSSLNVTADSIGCEFYSGNNTAKTEFQLPHKYLVLAAGAAHIGKRFTPSQIEKLSSLSNLPLVLLGDKNDFQKTDSLHLDSRTVNLCGKTSISELGSIIENSSGVISGDTGIMHIASCFKIPQVSVWGCTRPSLGMWPYLKKNHLAITPQSKRPCTKLGNKCRNHPENCMNQHSATHILSELQLLIKEKSL